MAEKPIDLDALQRSAARTDSPNALVTRRWLAAVARELAAARAALGGAEEVRP